MTAGNPDLRPFRERVLELLNEVSPGSGMKPANEVLNRLRERIGSWVDERLRLYERTSADVEELRADRVKLQDENGSLRHDLREAQAKIGALVPPEVENLHVYCGADAVKWAEQFRLRAIKLGYSDMDQGWLCGWFANAIERAIEVRCPRNDLGGFSKPSDIEALADTEHKNRVADAARLTQTEAGIAALAERHYELRAMFDRAETRTINVLDAHSTAIAALKFPDGEKQDGAAFPTGAATTVEEVLEQVQEAGQSSDETGFPVSEQQAVVDDGPPRRGDRVRLEGARTVGGRVLEPGWFDCTGQEAGSFQVEAGGGRYWVDNYDLGLKEVRRGAANLPA